MEKAQHNLKAANKLMRDTVSQFLSEYTDGLTVRQWEEGTDASSLIHTPNGIITVRVHNMRGFSSVGLMAIGNNKASKYWHASVYLACTNAFPAWPIQGTYREGENT